MTSQQPRKKKQHFLNSAGTTCHQQCTIEYQNHREKQPGADADARRGGATGLDRWPSWSTWPHFAIPINLTPRDMSMSIFQPHQQQSKLQPKRAVFPRLSDQKQGNNIHSFSTPDNNTNSSSSGYMGGPDGGSDLKKMEGSDPPPGAWQPFGSLGWDARQKLLETRFYLRKTYCIIW